MTINEKVEVFRAWCEGIPIQVRFEGGETWYDEDAPKWEEKSRHHRIKPDPPKPRDFWIPIAYQDCWREPHPCAPAIHVREVL